MSTPAQIPVAVGTPGPTSADAFGNALPILSEIRQALRRLIDGGEPSCIDLAAMPFGPGDEAQLLELLGRGEVDARVDALGPTHVRETAIPCVWLVDYRDADDQRLALQIEITEVPPILRGQLADLADGLRRLDHLLSERA